MLLIKLEQSVLISTGAQEIVFLLHLHQFATTIRAATIFTDLVAGEKSLAGFAIHAPIGALIHITLINQPLKQLLHHSLVTGLSGADKVVIRRANHRQHIAKNLRKLIHQLLRSHPLCLSGFSHLLAMFIGAGQEKDLITAQSMKSSRHVSCKSRISTAHMGHIVHIINWRCNIKFFAHLFPSFYESFLKYSSLAWRVILG